MKKQLNGVEKRKYIRLEKAILVRFRVIDKTKKVVLENWQDGISIDVGKGGIRMELYDPDKKLRQCITNHNNILEIEMPLYFKKKTRLKGKVEFIRVIGESVWNRNEWKEKEKKFEIGISFLKSTSKEGKLIADFINHNLKQ